MTEKRKIDIAACPYKDFIMPTGVMIYSVCYNHPDLDIDFHILTDESVTLEDKQKLKETISDFQGKKILFYNVNSSLYKRFPINRKANLTISSYYRLLFTEYLPQSVERVLYLDGDCVVRQSLLPLWKIDLSGYAVAAVSDIFAGDTNVYKRLRYSPEIGYFNAGVLLINLDYWRKNNVIDDFMDYLKTYPERIVLEDQDVLNVIFQKNRKPLPVRYNFQVSFLRKGSSEEYNEKDKEIIETQKDPVIVHFAGIYKPWDKCMRHPTPFNSTFYKYQNQTIWKGFRQERRRFRLRAKNLIADILRQLKLLPPMKKEFIDVPPID